LGQVVDTVGGIVTRDGTERNRRVGLDFFLDKLAKVQLGGTDKVGCEHEIDVLGCLRQDTVWAEALDQQQLSEFVDG
jgi:hypothetical protein